MRKLLFILFLLITTNAFGALSKSVETLDNWTAIAQNAVATGAVLSVSGNYQTTLQIDCALTSTTAQTNGTEIRVQTSSAASGNDSWADLTSLGGPTGTANSEVLASPGVTSQASFSVLSTTGYTLPTGTDNGWRYAKDTTIANSELVIQTGLSANSYISLADYPTNSHAVTTTLYNIVNTYVVNIPDSANRVRVLYNNTKDAAGSTVDVRSKVTKITGI